MQKKQLNVTELQTLKQLYADIDILLKNNLTDKAFQLLSLYKALIIHNNELSIVYYLLQIDSIERKSNISHTIFTKVNTIADAVFRYTYLKFLLRRLEYDMPGAEYVFIECNKLMNYSSIEIQQISLFSCISPNDAIRRTQEALINEQ